MGRSQAIQFGASFIGLELVLVMVLYRVCPHLQFSDPRKYN